MSAILVNKISVVKTPTSEWKYSIKLGEDKITASGSYTDDYQGWTNRIPILGTAHPDIIGMILIGIDATREEGDMIKVDLKYESSAGTAQYPGRPPSAENQKRYALEITRGEEHILTSIIYGDNLPEAEIEALMAISNGTSKEEFEELKALITSDLGLAALAKIRTGFIARKSSGIIWVEKSTTDNLADVEEALINTIYLPPGPVPDATEANWLYLGTPATETAEGGYYDLEKRWEHKTDGWDTDIYGAP